MKNCNIVTLLFCLGSYGSSLFDRAINFYRWYQQLKMTGLQSQVNNNEKHPGVMFDSGIIELMDTSEWGLLKPRYESHLHVNVNAGAVMWFTTDQ